MLYVENDAALRNVLGGMLSASTSLQMLGSFGTANEVLQRDLVLKADVALLDFSLDPNGLNGVELGIALRNINEYIGIVIYSQFSVRPMINRVPKQMRSGWSFFDKSVTMDISDYAKILQSTAAGKGNWEEVLTQDGNSQNHESSIFFSLSPRQRSIMSLTSQGKSAQEIATQLNLSYSYVRKELSRAYGVLVPNPVQGDDLKTGAVLKYMELMRLS